jgi:lactoylglutathione lyase
MKLEHVAIWTVDLEAMRAFHEQYFDAPPDRKYENARKRPDIARIPGAAGSPGVIGYAHRGVELGSRAAVDALTGRLQDDGFPRLDGRD